MQRQHAAQLIWLCAHKQTVLLLVKEFGIQRQAAVIQQLKFVMMDKIMIKILK